MLPEIAQEYREAHAYVFDRRDRPTDEQDTPVSTSRGSDITSQVALEQIPARDRLKRFSRKLQHLDDDLHSVLAGIKGLFATAHDGDDLPLAAYRTPTPSVVSGYDQAKDRQEERALREELERIENRARQIRYRLRNIA